MKVNRGRALDVMDPPLSLGVTRLKIVKESIKWTMFAFIACLFVLAFALIFIRVLPFEKVPLLGGYRPLVVIGRSMEPAIGLGCIVFVRPVRPQEIKPGDVISYKQQSTTGPATDQSIVTHRVKKICRQGHSTVFVTKGDANRTVDSGEVSSSSVLGRVEKFIPYFGMLGLYAKTKLGFILLIILPGILVIANELKNIAAEILKLREAQSA